jgi:hypothetical protein
VGEGERLPLAALFDSLVLKLRADGVALLAVTLRAGLPETVWVTPPLVPEAVALRLLASCDTVLECPSDFVAEMCSSVRLMLSVKL